MSNFDIFISHSSSNKELARVAFYTAVTNGMKPWFDEALFDAGADMQPTLEGAINDSKSFLLFHSKQAMTGEWVPMEMEAAKKRREQDSTFNLIVIKLDREELPTYWQQFLFDKWKPDDQPGSVIRLYEALFKRKITVAITGAAFLTAEPSNVFFNQTASLAEHTRNYVLYYMAHVKGLLHAVATVGHPQEHHDTLNKLLKLSLFEGLPICKVGGCLSLWAFLSSFMRIE